MNDRIILDDPYAEATMEERIEATFRLFQLWPGENVISDKLYFALGRKLMRKRKFRRWRGRMRAQLSTTRSKP